VAVDELAKLLIIVFRAVGLPTSLLYFNILPLFNP
jgi:hypothetical protein